MLIELALFIFSGYLCYKLFSVNVKNLLRYFIGDIFILVSKGVDYFKDDLAKEALTAEDGVVIRQVLPIFPFGRLYAALIHGPNNDEIVHLLNTDDPSFREPNFIFASLIPSMANNPTDASFFLDSTKEGRVKRQRSFVKYVQDPIRLDQIFIQCQNQFTALFAQTNFWSLNDSILQIVYSVVGKVMMGLDYVDFDKMNGMIRAVDDAINYGSPPNIFSFASPSQQIVLKAKDTIDKLAKQILAANADSILKTDNYTGYIVNQSAKEHGGQPKDFILHKDVIASSPVTFLGVDNLPGPLTYALLHIYNKDLYNNTKFINQVKDECKNIKTYADAKACSNLDKLYLETLRIIRRSSHYYS